MSNLHYRCLIRRKFTWLLFLFQDEPLGNEDSDEEEESVSEMSEVRFIPEDRGLLDAMYHAMTVCQTLHPDPNDSVSDGNYSSSQLNQHMLATVY